jgi:hypothetical protein
MLAHEMWVWLRVMDEVIQIQRENIHIAGVMGTSSRSAWVAQDLYAFGHIWETADDKAHVY